MLKLIYARYPEITKQTDENHDTSKRFKVNGFTGSFGFISSMSDHFCDSCNRIRLTADGNLKVCLFGPSEVDLKTEMRKGARDEDLLAIIDQAGNYFFYARLGSHFLK